MGQEGRISFKIKVVDFQEEFLEEENHTISSKALLDSDTFEAIESDDASEETKIVDSNIIVNKVNRLFYWRVCLR